MGHTLGSFRDSQIALQAAVRRSVGAGGSWAGGSVSRGRLGQGRPAAGRSPPATPGSVRSPCGRGHCARVSAPRGSQAAALPSEGAERAARKRLLWQLRRRPRGALPEGDSVGGWDPAAEGRAGRPARPGRPRARLLDGPLHCCVFRPQNIKKVLIRASVSCKRGQHVASLAFELNSSVTERRGRTVFRCELPTNVRVGTLVGGALAPKL